MAGSRGRRAGACAVALFCVLCTLLAGTSNAEITEAERALERSVKAAFIYRFTDFITWPDAAFPGRDAPFVIAAVAREPMVDELRQVVLGRTAAGRPIEVRRIREGDVPPVAHIVFIADSERQRLGQIIRAAPRHALIVTETEGALTQGSVINFVITEGRVRFEVSLGAAERRSLRFNSRLLAVALAVRNGGR